MKVETKVGLLFLLAVGLTGLFAYLLGDFSLLGGGKTLQIAYNFAGGIEKGSPVRVMGIKVGKVKDIVFSPTQMTDGEEVNLKIIVTVEKKFWPAIRQDSSYFINLAGVIGEKFIEITPGSQNSPQIEYGAVVRGTDPPRIDQLISQSYSLAGKVMDFVQKNEGSVKSTLETMDRLVVNLNKLLVQADRTTNNKDVARLVTNLVKISDDMAHMTGKMRSEDGEKTMRLVRDLIWRLEALDAKAVKKFLQEEGIRAKIF